MRLPIIGKWEIRRKIILNSVVITILAIIAGVLAGQLSMNLSDMIRIDPYIGGTALAIVVIILGVLIFQLRRNLVAQEQIFQPKQYPGNQTKIQKTMFGQFYTS